MVKVAIAGGTGRLGRHIVEGILAAKKHTVIVLSRSSTFPALEAPAKFIWDVEKGIAQIPGDGSAPIVLTRAEDVGKFVAASLNWEKWPEYSQMRGDRKTLNEILEIAEAVRGKSFDVTYISKEKFEETIANEPTSSSTKFAAQFYIEVLGGRSVGFAGANLNDAFPEVQPVGAEEFLKKWWAKF